MRRLMLLVAVAAFALMGFTKEEAIHQLDGEWYGELFPSALRVDTRTGQATFIRGGVQISGALTFAEIVGRSLFVSIGTRKYIVHFRPEPNSIVVSEIGEPSGVNLLKLRR